LSLLAATSVWGELAFVSLATGTGEEGLKGLGSESVHGNQKTRFRVNGGQAGTGAQGRYGKGKSESLERTALNISLSTEREARGGERGGNACEQKKRNHNSLSGESFYSRKGVA